MVYHCASNSQDDRVGGAIQGNIVTGVEHLGGMELISQQVLLRDTKEINCAGMVRPPTDQVLHDPVSFAHKVNSCIALKQ